MIRAASPLHLVPGRRNTRRGVHATAAATLATALVLAPGPVSPAMAGGVTLNLVPRGEAAELLRHGLAIYGMIRERRNDARTDQRGAENGAAISQTGHGNAALVLQRGKGNSGTVSQIGNHNGFALLQFGRRNQAQVVQQGNGELGITIQRTW